METPERCYVCGKDSQRLIPQGAYRSPNGTEIVDVYRCRHPDCRRVNVIVIAGNARDLPELKGEFRRAFYER